MIKYFDAHNHLQDERFAGDQEQLISAAREAGVCGMVVNGSCEDDWPVVAALAEANPEMVLPAFGYHPWYIHQRGRGWRETLEGWLAGHPDAVLGEVGLDRWILDQPPSIRARHCPGLASREPASRAEQEEVFLWQLGLAAGRNLPVTIHCLQAWGRLHDLLRTHARPEAGFLLHSFNGPSEMIDGFVKLGAYFSFPGYFAHEAKVRQREAFRRVPLDRLLVETDAPDQLPPAVLQTHPIAGHGSDGTPALNHPANLVAIQNHLAAHLGIPKEEFAEQVTGNFERLFGASPEG